MYPIHLLLLGLLVGGSSVSEVLDALRWRTTENPAYIAELRGTIYDLLRQSVLADHVALVLGCVLADADEPGRISEVLRQFLLQEELSVSDWQVIRGMDRASVCRDLGRVLRRNTKKIVKSHVSLNRAIAALVSYNEWVLEAELAGEAEEEFRRKWMDPLSPYAVLVDRIREWRTWEERIGVVRKLVERHEDFFRDRPRTPTHNFAAAAVLIDSFVAEFMETGDEEDLKARARTVLEATDLRMPAFWRLFRQAANRLSSQGVAINTEMINTEKVLIGVL